MNPRINVLLRSAGLVTVGLAALSSTPAALARQESPAPSTPKPESPPAPAPAPPSPAPTTPPAPAQPEKKDDDKKPADPPKIDGAPTDAPKLDAPKTDPAKPEKKPEVPKPPPQRDGRGRVVLPEDAFTVLAFKNVSVDQVIPFIVEATGKIVIPQPDLLARRVTVINDQRIKTADALDYVFFALQQNQIGVVETKEMITLRDLADVVKQDVPVIGPEESLLDRKDLGTIVQKIFRFEHGSAENFAETLPDNLPDFAKKFLIDPTTNQIAVIGNVALLQRIERLVDAFDVPSSAALTTETYHLRFADAEKIAANIRELFAADATTNRGNQNNQFNPQFRGFNPGGDQNQGRQRRNQGQQQDQALTSANLRVTANTQQNSVTVLAERVVQDQIKKQVTEYWDVALSKENVIPRTYDLKYADPIKVRNLLESLFGNNSTATGSSTGVGGGGGQGGGGGGNRGPGGGGNNPGATAPTSGQGAGRLAGQFVFEAIPEMGQLVVVAKSPDNLAIIDDIIKGLDKPQIHGMPKIIPLKHAQAEELAEQLNAILAQEGTLAQITKAATGLSTDSANTSPFSTNATSTTTTNNTTTTGQNTANNTYQFWWQRARPPTDTSGSFSLVSKVRIVPVWRQNSLMLLAPPEYQDGLADFIEQLDSPGRQVLIAAIVAEIKLDDATALGLRWSSQGISPTNADNSLTIGNAVTGTKNELINSLFDTSVLTTTTNVNLLLQALAQRTAVNILSEPRIFTSDNQEASFFDGQDVPFVNQLENTNNNNPIQSFDYRAVGIKLGVRPRITINMDVDLQVNLELSSISPGQTVQNALIVDRRQTTTHLIVKNGQTIVISGILRRQDSEIKRKIPILGDIPFLGYLFTSSEVSHSNTELIAFITPIVVENTAAADKVNAKDLQRLDELRRNEFNKDGSSQPSDLVKPANDTVPIKPVPDAPANPEAPPGNPPASDPGIGG